MKRNPFGRMADPGCTCPTVTDLLEFALQEQEPALCPVHQADAVAAREREAEVAEAVAARDLLVDTISDLRTADELAERRAAREARINSIADPLERSVVRLTTRHDDHLPLGLHPSAYKAIHDLPDSDPAA